MTSSPTLNLISRDGYRDQVNREMVARYFFFTPEKMRLGRDIQLPLSEDQLRLFISFVKTQADGPVGRPIFPLSEMGAIMEFMQPLDEYWWVRCAVDEGVVDREAALHNLGLYVRSGSSPPPYVYFGASPSLYNGGFSLHLDPAWNEERASDIEGGTWHTSIWPTGTWTEAIRDEAFAISWLNILYGILESAWLIRVSPLDKTFNDRLTRVSQDAHSYFEIGAQNINWSDIVEFIPGVVTMNGLASMGVYEGSGYVRTIPGDVMKKLQSLSRDIDRSVGIVSAVLSLSDREVIPFDNFMIPYQFDRANMTDLSVNLSNFEFGYIRSLKYTALRANQDNIRETVISLGLAPLLKGGKRTDINELLPPRDVLAMRRRLVEEGLSPLGTERDWTEIEAVPEWRELKEYTGSNPLYGYLESDRHDSLYGLVKNRENGPIQMLASVLDKTGDSQTRRDALLRLGIEEYSHRDYMYLDELQDQTLRMGYEGDIIHAKYLVQKRYDGPEYKINLLHLPALLHNQVLFRYPGGKGFSVMKKNYPSIVSYMRETIGKEAMMVIASILILYAETHQDKNVIEFASLLLEGAGDGVGGFIETP